MCDLGLGYLICESQVLSSREMVRIFLSMDRSMMGRRFSFSVAFVVILGIVWEDTTPCTELPKDFCAGIGPLQLGVVLVLFLFN